jgi:hypothetical protein
MSPQPDPDKTQALGLTVYDLPQPEAVAQADGNRSWSGRWRMLALLLVCASPVIASYVTYYLIRPETRRSFGELIEPQRDLPPLTTTALDGRTASLPELKGQWLLISVSSAACAAQCEQNLYFQRQIHAGLGKERDKLDRVWLVTDSLDVSPALLASIPGSLNLRVDPQGLGQWLAPQVGHGLTEHLYLVDPMGRWMMRFPPQLAAENAPKLKRDLERLIRAAKSWDLPGR